jgi:hypothetical protein
MLNTRLGCASCVVCTLIPDVGNVVLTCGADQCGTHT